LLHALHERAGTGDEPVPHITGQSAGVEFPLDESGRQQGPQLGREQHDPAARGVRHRGVVERLLPQRVAGQQEGSFVPVPQGEREHAAQPADTVAAPPCVGVEDHFRIRLRPEHEPVGGELLSQFAKVIHLAVEHQDGPTNRVRHRLRPGRAEVENGEPAVCQGDPGGCVRPEPVPVRPAVELRPVGAPHRF